MTFEVLDRGFALAHSPTAMCHASTVLPIGETVLAAWFGGSREGESDTAIWYAARRDGVWSRPASIAHIQEAHWNPVLRESGGNIYLYYKVGGKIADWRTMECVSADGGRTWSLLRELVAGDVSGGRGPVRNKIIRLSSGRLLAPGSTERGVWTAFADRSDDGGITWTKSPPIAVPGLVSGGRTVTGSDIAVSEQSFYGRGVIQPTLWESTPGSVHMLLRSTEGSIFRSDSVDGGETWTDPTPTALANNNSGIDLDRLEDGRLVLACNPVADNWGARSPMRLLVSEDNGESWETMLDLDSGRGEFAYPAVVARGKTIFVTYTWKREKIAFWEIYMGSEGV